MLSIVSKEVIDRRRTAVTGETAVSWGTLIDWSDRLTGQLESLSRQRVGVVFHGRAASFALVAALDRLACDTFLLDDQSSSVDLQELTEHYQCAALVDVDAENAKPSIRRLENVRPGSGASTVSVLTSGTTGTSKAARHTWATLARPTRVDPRYHHTRWLLSYRPHLYAGLQVIMQCLVNGGTLVVPSAGATAEEVADRARTIGIEYASGTPSYWRWLTTFAETRTLRQIPFEQISLGGEVADQAILDRLASLYPDARIAHIYATTELGKCFTVSDGRAGFPETMVSDSGADDVELRVVDGELWARSRNAMLEYDPLSAQPSRNARWVRTGDLVERRGDRYLFAGRDADLINVGGAKVSPVRVEQTIVGLPGVREARVFAKRSSIVGQMVACEVVVDPSLDATVLKRRIRSVCRESLSPHEEPRFIQIVDRIELSPAYKKVRS